MKGFPVYLILDIFTLFGPLALSFDKKVAFYKKWNALFPAITIVGFIFVVWDVWFTEIGVWSFNDDYLIGLKIFNLPIEEVLFFFVVPYACIFIYECCKAYFPNYLSKQTQNIPFLISLVLCVVLFFAWGKLYTTVTFLSTAILLVVLLRLNIIQQPKYGYFWLAYFIHLIPFFIINGFLTAIPIVIYNNNENLGIRLTSIPIEDSIYSLLLLIGNVIIYEKILSKRVKSEN
ncbi:MAG: lycopene cyclase domain-containing protein [Cytophagales bacterium]